MLEWFKMLFQSMAEPDPGDPPPQVPPGPDE